MPSNAKIFSCQVELDPEMLARLKAAPQIAEKAFGAALAWWHDNILPEHFKPQAHFKYGYAQRTAKWLRQKRKKGSDADLVFSGSLMRDLMSKASIKIGSQGASLSMSARVLNFAPNMPQNTAQDYVKHKNKTYPNLKREVRAITPDEEQKLADMVRDIIVKELNGEAA